MTSGRKGRGGGRYPAWGNLLVSGKDWFGGNGVDVISNGGVGICHNGCADAPRAGRWGIPFQCVELVETFLHAQGWITSPIYGNAKDIYGNAPASRFDKHPSGDGYRPVPGDVIVWHSSGDGHVAVVEYVTSDRVGFVEENSSPSGRGTALLSQRLAYGRETLTGILHAKANTSGVATWQTGGPLDLWFAKTHNSASGHVEVHSATAVSGYQNGQHSVTWFSPGDADNGWFQMVGPDLFFIKTKNPGSGHVEVHSATAVSGYQNGQHSVTWFSPGDADNGWFQMVGPDLYFIKTKNPGSGRVEVHSATAASGYQNGQHSVTWFSPADADNGWFQMVGPDLYFIKTRSTGSGHVEIHSATAASGYQSGQHTVTWLSPADASNGWFQMVGSDLYFVKSHNPGSGHVEVHSALAALGYQDGQHSVTWFSPGDADNGWFQIAGSKG